VYKQGILNTLDSRKQPQPFLSGDGYSNINRNINTNININLNINWIDIHTQPEALKMFGIDADVAFVRERLHVLDAQGKLHIGAAAFAQLMAHTPSQKRLASFTQLPVIAPLLSMVYNVFAKGLYTVNRLCKRW
jgi:predicted DCC family thiol-disulfide oxidoreductase YuxK